MFKPNKLLKVIAMLMIIFGILGLIMTAVGSFALQGLSGAAGVDTASLGPATIAVSLISGVACVAAGFLARAGKNFKAAAMAGGIYTAMIIISDVMAVVGGTFTAAALIGLIIPLLFWWGMYQSK